MKHLILFAFFLSSSFAFGQDLIITISGDSIKCKLVRVEDAEIQFRINNGPVIHMDKRGVASFQYNYAKAAPATSNNRRETRAKYEDPIYDAPAHVPQRVTEERAVPLTSSMLVADGRKVYQDGRQLTPNEVRGLMANTDAFRLYNKGITKNRHGNILLIIGGCLSFGGGLVWNTIHLTPGTDKSTYHPIGYAVVISGGVGVITGVILKPIGKKNIRQSVNTYNSVKRFANVELKFGVTGNGAGLVLNF